MTPREEHLSAKTIPIMLALACLLLIGGCAVFSPAVVFPPPKAAVNMLYDDDCDDDIDCAVTQPILHHWIDLGYVKIWGMVSSGSSQFGAPAMRIFQKYYGHEGLYPIGALTPGCASQESAPWYVALVGKFDPGDVCTNYANCGIVMRQSVASYVAAGGETNGLAYVLTGPLTCEEEFRATPPDSISSLTGAQMEKQFISEFVLMNGCATSSLNPTSTCSGEYNCSSDIGACSAFFANVTSSNGYPSVYVVPDNTGATNVVTQVPVATLPLTNPTAYAFAYAGRTNSADEDALAVEYAVFGSTGWNLSANSTDIVNVSTEQNSWSGAVASGQYYLTIAVEPAAFEILLDPPWLPGSNSAAASISRWQHGHYAAPNSNDLTGLILDTEGI